MTRFGISCLLLWLFSSLSVDAQIQDDFSDGNFNASPSWAGDATSFTVNANQQLQLDAPAVDGEAVLQLFAPTSLQATTNWRMFVNLNFSPSATNYARIWLASDASDFNSVTKGYYLQMGESGSDDAIRLYRRSPGQQDALLISGSTGGIATGANVGIRVQRTNTGLWQLYVDYSGNANYFLNGSTIDTTHNVLLWFGIQCVYTQSNSTDFTFDNFLIDPIFTDNAPPQVLSVTANSLNSLTVVFDEPVTFQTAAQSANYQVSGNPTIGTITMNPDVRSVVVPVSPPLPNFSTHTLTIAGVKDLFNNTMQQVTTSFTTAFAQTPAVGEVIINEIFFDPTPSNGLPPHEFVELWNRGSLPVDLDSCWLLHESTATGTVSLTRLPQYILPANGLVIVYDNSATGFAVYQDTLMLTSFPTLNNTGAKIALRRPDGFTIDSVRYDLAYYQDPGKEDGGWSLELINPYRLCAGRDNWKASIAPIGGSPAAPNSVLDNTPDSQPATVVAAYPYYPDTLSILFDEVLDSSMAVQLGNYSLSPAVSISHAIYNRETNTVVLALVAPLADQQPYELSIQGIADCSGNVLAGTVVVNGIVYVYGYPPLPGELVINEILADHSPAIGLPETDYIELLNTGSRILNLSNCTLSDGVTTCSPFPTINLLPDSIIIVSDAGEPDLSSFGRNLRLSNFPAFNASGDLVVLADAQGQTIEALRYDAAWYEPDGKANGGWSLERIDATECYNGKENWAASTHPNGGTPGIPNSSLGLPVTPPLLRLRYAYPLSADSLLLAFNRAVSFPEALQNSYYTLSPALPIDSVYLIHPLNETLHLKLAQPLAEGVLYELSVAAGLPDCSGTGTTQVFAAPIALPETAEVGDVVINELLFNPNPYGSDFVELYNRSSKTLRLADFILANAAPNGDIDELEALEQTRLFFPSEYLAISPDTASILSNYSFSIADQLCQNDLPAYPDEEGQVVLLYTGILGFATEMDRFSYTESLHNPLLDQSEGISLERVSTEVPTTDLNNWQSAATTFGYATPGRENSMLHLTLPDSLSDLLHLPVSILSPDGDAWQDYLEISCTPPAPGWIATLHVYSVNGLLVKTLVPTTLLTGTQIFLWHGETDEGERAPTAPYVILGTFTSPTGQVIRLRKTCTVAERL